MYNFRTYASTASFINCAKVEERFIGQEGLFLEDIGRNQNPSPTQTLFDIARNNHIPLSVFDSQRKSFYIKGKNNIDRFITAVQNTYSNYGEYLRACFIGNNPSCATWLRNEL